MLDELCELLYLITFHITPNVWWKNIEFKSHVVFLLYKFAPNSNFDRVKKS